ncbi:Type-1 restriction enzyme EcoKI specificity protein [Lactococcus lactis]|uniref:Type I restriction-modification system specificity subunit S n=1 Tax=Lactococcus lactis subsp. lactis TaxID=1360 RepID=A0A0V8ENE1_LACLL|nr:restriction endonuclease subunit S [Lactococcus lactis]KSU27224.1 Type I restriction-modification system specificity subunit S [Lactococcus lactis subsp. lactis]MDU0409239.1 Type-1 restriction enzyme EcoKI specificity protein [Lactococcus lactis]NRD17333.1 restriction endonuclease subunit S [Lactococcus lactis subsp. lactis]
MKERLKAPELRFPGFTDDWEERKLGELTTSFSGGTPSAGNSSYYKGDIPFIRSGEINSDKTELFLTEAGLKSSSAKMVSVGDILYALYGATSGEVGISQINGAINQAILAIKPCDGYNSHFLMQWLKLKKQKIIDQYLQGGQGNLSGSIVKNLVLKVPNFEEQKKIGAFFKQLDDTIALHQRKLDLLKEQKKGFLQKMFPKNGAKVPELRFAGFADDWEERKLIDLATTYIGLVTTMTENYTNKGTLLIRNSDIKEGRFDLSNPIYLEEQFAEENKTRRMRKGDVVTVHTGDIGTSAMINSELDGAIGFATITTRPTKELDSNFLAWYFNSNYHKKYAKRMSTGDGRSNYNMKDFNKNVIPTPQIDEQQKIGAFFKQLDDTIALHQRKLDLLKEQKKGYLQKMFV